MNKATWPQGPWTTESDKLQWQDPATNLPCLIVRNSLGFLCGYVGLPPEHKLHGADYNDVSVEVHGGLTYADACQGDICHIPEPGQPDNVWWLGFDCGHFSDMAPGMVGFSSRGTYRGIAYVKAECTSLAAQLAALPC